MATLLTLSPAAKSALSSAGCTLTPAQEHVAATAEASGFDWATFLKNLGQQVLQNLPAIVNFVIGLLAAKQAPAKQATPGTCDHHACACDCLAAALKTVEVCAAHCCECCCE